MSPEGRYIGTAETTAGVPVPFVYDTLTSTRQNLPRAAADTMGGIVGAIADTGRVLGTIYNSTASFAVMWDAPNANYVTMMNVLRNDGHVATDINYAGWNLYNGGDGISADGRSIGVYGNNPFGFEDSLLLQTLPPAGERLCLGNAVWNDANANGPKEVGESGVSGVVLRLYHTGADGEIGGTGDDADYETIAFFLLVVGVTCFSHVTRAWVVDKNGKSTGQVILDWPKVSQYFNQWRSSTYADLRLMG